MLNIFLFLVQARLQLRGMTRMVSVPGSGAPVMHAGHVAHQGPRIGLAPPPPPPPYPGPPPPYPGSTAQVCYQFLNMILACFFHCSNIFTVFYFL